jgi:hypothetical protein
MTDPMRRSAAIRSIGTGALVLVVATMSAIMDGPRFFNILMFAIGVGMATRGFVALRKIKRATLPIPAVEFKRNDAIMSIFGGALIVVAVVVALVVPLEPLLFEWMTWVFLGIGLVGLIVGIVQVRNIDRATRSNP